MTAEWITAIAAVVTAIATGILAGTVVIAWLQLKADHERSRRERAIELIRDWSKSLNPKASVARKFAEILNKEQTLSLAKGEVFSIDEKYKTLLESCLGEGENELKTESGKITLTIKQVSTIRWEVISYLNKLEAILSAWHHNIADKGIIEEEFRYLISPADGHELLPEFLSAANNAYPAISAFAKYINDKNGSKGKNKIA